MEEIKLSYVDEKIYKHLCRSGLIVYVWPYDLNDQVLMTITTRFGNVHNDFKVEGKEYHVPSGTAHFLEHVKFNIKKDLTAHDIFYKLGSYTNAYTTYDHTLYEVECSENIEENLSSLLSFVYTDYFTDGLVRKEKPIIIEEAKSVLDDPYNKGYFELQQNVYKNSKYKNIITGSPDEIRKITKEDIENAYKYFYHPENMFLIVTGNVNPYDVEKVVDDFFKTHEFPKYVKPELIIKSEGLKVNKSQSELECNVTKEKALIAFKYAKNEFLNKYSLLELKLIVGIILLYNYGSVSKLHSELLNNGLIDSLFYSVEESENNIVIYFETSTSYPEEIIRKVIDTMSNLEVTQEELQRRKKVLLARSILGFDSPTGINDMIKNDLIDYNEVINNIEEYYQNINYEDVKKVIKMMAKNSNSYVILKPKKEA